MADYAHKARKRFGQNFLHDRHIVARILDAIAPLPGQTMVEIGPGLGALTADLIARAGRLTAVEIDRELAARLRQRFAADQLSLVAGDALALDWRAVTADLGGAVRIVGNLPYNISTPLLFALLPAAGLVCDQHFLLQREVVQRMAAPPGSREYGRLSVMLQFRYRIEDLLRVAPGAFHPVPKVHSSLVRMTPLPPTALAAVPLAAFAAVVGAAFGQRRKTLKNALAPRLSAAQIASVGVDPGARAEMLDVAAYVRLTQLTRPATSAI